MRAAPLLLLLVMLITINAVAGGKNKKGEFLTLCLSLMTYTAFGLFMQMKWDDFTFNWNLLNDFAACYLEQ